jgi:hypothetical protein
MDTSSKNAFARTPWPGQRKYKRNGVRPPSTTSSGLPSSRFSSSSRGGSGCARMPGNGRSGPPSPCGTSSCGRSQRVDETGSDTFEQDSGGSLHASQHANKHLLVESRINPNARQARLSFRTSRARRRRSPSSNGRRCPASLVFSSRLFAKERDDIGLLKMQPDAPGRDQQLGKTEHVRSFHHCSRSSCETVIALALVGILANHSAFGFRVCA